MTRRMYDAAYPPSDPHLDVCAFYIGGDTPHVWSDSEITGQSARWRLPIFTRSNPGSASASTDAFDAISWLTSHNVPKGSAVALDYETAVNSAYVIAFDQAIVAAGWKTLLYGSLSYVMQNPRPSAGYWTASWTQSAHIDSGAAATQWAGDVQLGQPYDLSDVSDSLVLWDTQNPNPTPVPVPTPVLTKKDNDMLVIYVAGDATIYGLSNGKLWGIADTESVVSYEQGGAVVVHVTAKEFANLVTRFGAPTI